MADRERSDREKSEMKKKDNVNGNHGQLTPDDRDTKKRTQMQLDPNLVTRQLLF